MSAAPKPALTDLLQPAFPDRLPFIRPSLPPLDSVLTHYAPAYSSGLVTNFRLVARFEDAARDFLGVTHAVAVSSCTAGLILTLNALGLRGEVILPSLTFFATAHAVRWNRLTPVFADCHPHTWTLDPAAVIRLITPRTSAILPVHLYGGPCDIDSLQVIASRYKLKLIFDAAHAFGSRYRLSMIGASGDAEVFSFSPTKLLVAGEGGLVTTSDATLARRLRAARNYGDPGTYDPILLGLNARMPEFNAALALEGLPRVPSVVRRYNEIARRYDSHLSSLPGFSFQQVDSASISTCKDYCVAIDPQTAGFTRDWLAARLLELNIDTRKYFYPPLHRQKLYRRAKSARAPLPVTDSVSSQILSLPIYSSLSDQAVDAIAITICTLSHQARTAR